MFSLSFFRGAKRAAPPQSRAVAAPGAPDSIPSDLSPKELMREVVDDAMRRSELSLAGRARIIRKDDQCAVVMIDVSGEVPDQETLRGVENHICSNARALLGISAMVYWRGAAPSLQQTDRVSRLIQQEIQLLRTRGSRAATA